MAALQKVAVVTGAGTGIGKAVALALMKEGYAAVFAGRRKDKLEEAASATASPMPVPAPVTTATFCNAAIRGSSSRLKSLVEH